MTKFTDAQQNAINCNDTNILVSAAAGSGKTAVLTERIFRHVSQNINIDDLLVVTFTEAASAEMRERIAKRFTEAGLQIARLPLANISTIHSFCRKLVQEHFQIIDIDPAFRVGDEAELSLIRTQVMNELFESEYARENNEDFVDLADVYGGKTMDGRLDVLVRKLHDFMESDPFPLVAARRYADCFLHMDLLQIESTPWAAIVRDELLLGLEGALEGLNQAISICSMPGGPIKYYDKLDDEKSILENLRDITLDGNNFTEMYEAFLNIDWGRLPRITEKDDVNPELKERVQDIRDDAVKKRINALVKGVFFAPPGKMQGDLSALAPRVAALMDLAIRFSTAFATEKRTRNLLDFSDLEHFAIRILYPNGPDDMTPAEVYKFYEVLTDEYQDSNEVQDLILSAVAKRRFMVGDVKQSIYRFRRANPHLFQHKYRTYRPIDVEGTNATGTRIDLSHNFRSRPEVLNAANFFFSQLMCLKVGEVEYDNLAALHPGRNEYPDSPNLPQMWVELLDQSDEYYEAEEESEEDTPDNIIAETRMLAHSINELLSSRQVWDEETKTFRLCRPGDIAILTRGLSSMAGTVIEELKNHNIDAIADMDAGFLEQLEVKTALAFLRVTDNPRQDIDLITVLRSPVYGLTDDELLAIKQQPLSDDIQTPLFYDHLAAYNTDGITKSKIEKFFTNLENWRNSALNLPISRLIGLIYDDTQYPAHVMAMPGGVIRQANLRLLLERAIEFEETSFKGLFHFVHYIEQLYDSNVKSKGAIAEPTQNETNGRVRIMTIHKSKGLEFPIVICAFLGKKFNTDDMRQPVILHSELGVGPYYVDSKLRTRSNTLARFSLARLTKRENLSEELRCLYVALTRAQELLILSGRVKNLTKYLEKCVNHINTPHINLPTYYRSDAKTYLDWLIPCLLRHNSAKNLTDINSESPAWNHPADFRMRIHTPFGPSQFIGQSQSSSETHSKVGENYVRPDTQSALPSKLSISEIKRLYDITPDSTIADTPAAFEPPEFIKSKNEITPMQMGSALHVVTEHLDYNTHTTIQAVDGLIYDLAAKNLLTPEEAAFIDRKKIETLISSPLATRIRNSPKVYKETPFILALPAAELYPDNPAATEDETVLVHGIIDCYFEEDDQIVLLDYKSDAQPDRHIVQMQIYKKAIENATNKIVKEVLIYSFALSKAISV